MTDTTTTEKPKRTRAPRTTATTGTTRRSSTKLAALTQYLEIKIDVLKSLNGDGAVSLAMADRIAAYEDCLARITS